MWRRLLMGAAKLRKMMKTVRHKKTQSKQSKDEEINANSSREIRTFFEKRGTISSSKTSIPENVVELSDDE